LCDSDETECPQPIPDSWVEYPNSHVYDGVATRDSDLDGCRMSCSRNSSCRRLDWSGAAAAGEQCWLHGPWSSTERRRSLAGVNHYELRRSARAHWVEYGNTSVRGGIASDAAELAACKDLCLHNASCTRVDWVQTAAVGGRCWIHGHWSDSESRRAAQRVVHYELYRGSDGFCGVCDVTARFWSATAKLLTLYPNPNPNP